MVPARSRAMIRWIWRISGVGCRLTWPSTSPKRANASGNSQTSMTRNPAPLVELPDIQIVNICERMRDAPGHLSGVREVREGRHARDSQADRIELIAAQMHLRIHARQLQSAMRVASEYRPAGGGPARCQGPVVAPAAGLGTSRQQAQRTDRLANIRQARDPPAGIGTGRNAQAVGPAVVVAQLGQVTGADDTESPCAPELEPQRAHQVAALPHGSYAVPALPWLRRTCHQPHSGGAG